MGALVLVALASACSDSPSGSGGSGVFDTGIAPVPLGLTAPTYAGSVPGGMLVRAGDEQRVLRDADQVRWMPGGVAIVDRSPRSIDMHLVDLGQDVPARATPGSGARVLGGDLPGRSVTQVNALNHFVRPARLTKYTPRLERLVSLPLPDTDDPAADDDPEIERGYYNVAPTISGATFVQWHDSSETYEDGDYGVARIEGGEVDNVLINERIVALYLAADGAGLLALRQSNGEPCGGCVVDQEVVEIDPASGEIAAEYGMPDEYVDDWRVAAMGHALARAAGVAYPELVRQRLVEPVGGRRRCRSTSRCANDRGYRRRPRPKPWLAFLAVGPRATLCTTRPTRLSVRAGSLATASGASTWSTLLRIVRPRHFIVAAPDGVLVDVITPIEPDKSYSEPFA